MFGTTAAARRTRASGQGNGATSISVEAKKICDLLERIHDAHAFNGYYYRFFSPGAVEGGVSFTASNYPSALRDLIERTRANSVVKHSLTAPYPLTWMTDRIKYAHREGDKVIGALIAYGVCSGVTLPMHCSTGEVGIFSLGLRARAELSGLELKEVIGLIYVDALQVFKRSRAVGDRRMVADVLSQRQRECLYWCAAGKTSWEIAKILGISKQTVDFHFRSVCERTGAISRTQAVARSQQSIQWESFAQAEFERVWI